MIFYTNTKINIPHMAFVGRWTPFHKGHTTIINKKRQQNPDKPVLILVRSTDYDKYPPLNRANLIKLWMIENKVKGTIMIIPDIEGVYWGRGVGYKTETIEVDKEITKISATKIRQAIVENDWVIQKHLASDKITDLVQERTSKIIEKGLVIWLTGCPCSGKTTISDHLYKKIKKHFPYLQIQQLDGDVIRGTAIAEGLGFSPADRNLHIRRMGELAKMFANHGILVLASFISPDASVREKIKHNIGEDRFIEVYVKASKKERIKRDVKGMYKQAIAGKIKNFTGYDAPYDQPDVADVICNTDKESVKESVDQVFTAIFGSKYANQK